MIAIIVVCLCLSWMTFCSCCPITLGKISPNPVKLPWQVDVFARIFRLSDIGEPTIPVPCRKARALFTNSIWNAMHKWGGKFFSAVELWVKGHKKTFNFLAKTTGIALVGIALLRRVGNWFSKQLEYELLLDKADYDYQSYGCNLNGIGGWLLSTMNQSSVNQYKYAYSVKRLEKVLGVPCFPQMMHDYAIHIGRDISLLVSDIENRFRGKRRNRQKLGRHDSNESDASNGSKGYMDTAECSVVRDIERGISLLQAQQTDASLRLTRLKTLSALNTCEDLLVVWRAKLASKSQALRLPIPRVVLSHLPGLGKDIRVRTLTGLKRAMNFLNLRKHWSKPGPDSNGARPEWAAEVRIGGGTHKVLADDIEDAGQDVDDMLRDLNAWEKVILLEQMQESLYEKAGKIQHKLDELQGLRAQLANACQLSDDGPGEEAGAETGPASHDSFNGGDRKPHVDLKEKGKGEDKDITINERNRKGVEINVAEAQAESCQGGTGPRSLDDLWSDLNAWVRESSSLCADALDLLTMKSSPDDSSPQGHKHSRWRADPSSASTAAEGIRAMSVTGSWAGNKNSAQNNLWNRWIHMSEEGNGDKSLVARANGVDEMEDVLGKDLLLGNEGASGILTESVDIFPFQSQVLSMICKISQKKAMNVTSISKLRDQQIPFFPKGAQQQTLYEEPEQHRHEEQKQQEHYLHVTLGEFTVPGSLSDVLERCLVRHDAFVSAISALGDEAEWLGEWTKVNPTTLSNPPNSTGDLGVVWSGESVEVGSASNSSPTTTTESVAPLNISDSRDAEADTGAGSQSTSPANTALWTRAINFTHHRPAYLYGIKSTRHSVVQALNLENVRIDNETFDVGGSAVLVGFSNLSHAEHLGGCSYIMRWDFTAIPMHKDIDLMDEKVRASAKLRGGESARPVTRRETMLRRRKKVYGLNMEQQEDKDVLGPHRTSVSVTLEFVSPPSLLQHFVRRRLVWDMRMMVENWRVAASVTAIEGGGGLAPSGHSHLPHDVMELLAVLGKVDLDDSDDTHDVEGDGSATEERSQRSRPTHPGSNFCPVWSEPEAGLIENLNCLRLQWRSSALLMRDLARAPTAFVDHLEAFGLKVKSRRGLVKILRLKLLARIAFWSFVALSAVEASKRSEDILSGMGLALQNAKDFVHRHITTPTTSIVNDVIFNKRVSLTDTEALADAKRSLSVMLNDFAKEHKPKISEQERKRIVAQMDMTPISMEYEKELRRPMQNLVSGRIARLVLIQLQFVKKELLVAMQAIDELFNTNQVNLQLLAVTPAILSILMLQASMKAVVATIRSSSQGRFVESVSAVHRDLRSGMRDLERLLCMSPTFNVIPAGQDIDIVEMGRLMSILHRLQNILVVHASRFDDASLRQLQEDLRDILTPSLSVAQRLTLTERVLRSYPFLQPTRKLWPGSL